MKERRKEGRERERKKGKWGRKEKKNRVGFSLQ